eukprot:12431465-Karenia_brevis.AAC.2
MHNKILCICANLCVHVVVQNQVCLIVASSQGRKAVDSAESGGPRPMDNRKQELNMTQSAELTSAMFKAVEALAEKSQQYHGRSPVVFDFDVVEAWTHKQTTHARVQLVVKNGDLKEECTRKICLDGVKKCRLAFPWAEYWRLQMHIKAARQTAQFRYPILFLDFDHAKFIGAKTFAKFQYKHVYEHATAWSDNMKPYVVKGRVDCLIDGGFPIPDDPVEKYLPGRFSFTDAFFQSLPEGFKHEVRVKLAEQDLAEKLIQDEENSLMAMQDMESVAREAGASRKTAHFLMNLMKFPNKSFASPMAFKDVVEKETQNFDGLTNVFWRHLSAYEVRGRQPDEDVALFKMCCEVRNGPKRRRSAQDLDSFFDRMKIKVKDVQDHPYNGQIFSIFVNFFRHGPITAGRVISLLETSDDFAVAVEDEFGHWPFAYGMRRRHKEARDAFSTTFARCSEAPWLTEEADSNKCESILESLQKCAKAHESHHLNVVRARHLELEGASKQDFVKSTRRTSRRTASELHPNSLKLRLI